MHLKLRSCAAGAGHVSVQSGLALLFGAALYNGCATQLHKDVSYTVHSSAATVRSDRAHCL